MYVSTSGEYCRICWSRPIFVGDNAVDHLIHGPCLIGRLREPQRWRWPQTRSRSESEDNCSQLTHFLSPSVGQTEFNPHARRKIHRLAFAFCRFELDLLRRSHRRFIEAVAQIR